MLTSYWLVVPIEGYRTGPPGDFLEDTDVSAGIRYGGKPEKLAHLLNQIKSLL
jgi:hypothetical protein